MMRWAEKLHLRWRSLVRHRWVEQELEEELRFHLDQQVAENLAAGMTAEDARRAAWRAIGGAEQIKEECRDMRRVNGIVSTAQDLRYAGRVLRKSPVFTATAVVSLGLGIGANSAIFTAINAILWKPLPVQNPQSLVRFSVTRERRRETHTIPPAFSDDLRRSSTAFSELATTVGDGLSFSLNGRAERIMGEAVSHNFFSFLGVRPTLGQGFSEDVQHGRWAAEAVLSYRFWKYRFAGDKSVIGRTVHLNQYPFRIVGVAPAGFFGLSVGMEPELWVPAMPSGQDLGQMHLLSEAGDSVARLKTGVTLAQAQAATDAHFQSYLRELPPDQKDDLGHVRLLPDDTGDHGFVEVFERPLFALLGLVDLVLLIACANVASMLLARASARQKELAVRVSIGAGRARLVRQMLTESLVLWAAGGVAALMVASWTNQMLLGFLPQGHMRMMLDLRPDLRTVLFTCGVSMVTGFVFGIVPALAATRGDLTGALKTDAGGSIGERGRLSFRKVLVVSQVALSLVLLVVAGLFVQTLANLRATDFGYRPERVLLFRMKPQVELYSPQQVQKMTAELVRRLALVPGVQSAGLAEEGPLGSRGGGWTMIRLPNGDMVRATADEVSPGFFDTIGMRRLAGRDFSPADKEGSPGILIVNDVLARMLFQRDDPIGRGVVAELREARPFQVIGVVRASRYYDLHTAPAPAVYFAIQQITAYMPTLHVRVAVGRSSADVVAAVRSEFDALDKEVPVFDIKSLEDRVDDSLARERLVSVMAGAFGVLALVLAGIGLYGIMAYMVARRTREIGIRMALGSSPGAVLWMVAREALGILGAGIAVGLAAGMMVARLVASQLFGLTPADPLTILAATFTMLVVTGVATLIPARRAARVDPTVALRYE
jgi:predicted permease